ncbi:hypothetical protein TPHA_0P00150 [Tetrapisispora phaffii CBS 4417]|uniref:Uncharacterized protein n=1 Tax=Tetrapisispora phaffii (strain ATCC 24235 / CBS 4417 / NBRC 1672 / NRRL Y-8282 / UCD 70-5) TaxID=1071381 RepID=G8C1Z5_TETPH|nr:hypothetical protein TPHA_0P00150 [Tetrapisispora phaffii CBS 4417]CCE66173.1 hypothetical protein TPHA_0P00150 [Tetrapisispora phaffii CBS 4417]
MMEPSTPPRSSAAQFETPREHRANGPVTPAEGRRPLQFNLKASLLPPPVQQQQLKSPEYTPRRGSIKRRLGHEESVQMGAGSNLFGKLAEATLDQKLHKTCPGTPSHKIIADHNIEDYVQAPRPDDADDDDFEDVVQAPLANPFANESTLTKEDYRRRHEQLLTDHPELQSTITYCNKDGDVVKQKTLTQEEQDRFKPKKLFADQLDK